MASKDYEKHYHGLNDPTGATPTPNSVSRYAKVGERAFDTVVVQSGRAVLDSEFQLWQDAEWFEKFLLGKWQTPSGWLRGQSRYDSYNDYMMVSAPVDVVDDTGSGLSVGSSVGSVGGSVGDGDTGILPDQTMLNCFLLPRLEAVIAGHPVVVEYTNTRTPGWNLITVPTPTIYDGTDGSIKRTDFLFVEAWLALVAPSVKASGTATVADATALQAGDYIAISGLHLTATAGVPAADEFLIVAGSETGTAMNIVNALNLVTNSFYTFVSATSIAGVVTIQAVAPGTVGNAITLAVNTATIGAMSVSGPLLTGGEDRYSKPTDQSKIYRHGNVLSPAPVWLDDELVDPVVNRETTQRVQLQYRIRSTGANEGVNWKTHPDGFSNSLAGPPPTPGIFAQAGRISPASDVSGRFYPFVPADKTSSWGNSDADAYGVEDTGLWVAGDGSDQAAIDLGCVDGFVYALPICFMFRHNDCSNPLAAVQGWDFASNANGAPTYRHDPYTGPVGFIASNLSDRPDEEFCDVLTQNSVLDLRRHVSFPGVDLAGELQYQIQSLLDGGLRTWQIDTASKQDLGWDSGDVSTRNLICNEVGRIADGDNVTSGHTGHGVGIRDFDHIARRFGDQSVVERVVFAFYPGDRATGPVTAPGTVNPGKYVQKAGPDGDKWYEGDTLNLDLTNLDATTLGGIFQGLDGGGGSSGLMDASVAHFMPAGAVITEVLSIYHDDGHYTSLVPQEVQTTIIAGLGGRTLLIGLDKNDCRVNGGGDPLVLADYQMVGYSGSSKVGSPRRIFVEVEITYPNANVGLTDTPDHEIQPNNWVYDGGTPGPGVGAGGGPGPVIENDRGQRPNDLEGLLQPSFREGYREVALEYVANATNGHTGPDVRIDEPVEDRVVSRDSTHVYTPRRIARMSGGSVGATDVYVYDIPAGAVRVVDDTATAYGSSSREVVLTDALSAHQSLCKVEYFPQDPIPNYGLTGYQLSVYFRTNAPQTAGTKEGDIWNIGGGTLPLDITVQPLLVASNLWTGQVGMGSVDVGFPYATPLDQIPINDGIAPSVGEWYFCATANITVDDFNATTGLLSLHPFIEADGQNPLTLGGVGAGSRPRVDAEFRAYYPMVDPNAYRPTVISQPLYGVVRHKVFFPMLVRVTEEQPGVDGGILWRKNEVLLVVFSRFASLDEDNEVAFTDTNNTTCAAVYRTRNLLMIVG